MVVLEDWGIILQKVFSRIILNRCINPPLPQGDDTYVYIYTYITERHNLDLHSRAKGLVVVHPLYSESINEHEEKTATLRNS